MIPSGVPPFPGGGRRGWGYVESPQEEIRKVGLETEVDIPNREALSLFVFLGVAFTGLFWWARLWRVDAIAALFGLIGVGYWWRYGPSLEEELGRPGFHPVSALDWLCAIFAQIVYTFLVQLLPYLLVGAIAGAIVFHLLSFWFHEFPEWWGFLVDMAMAFSMSFMVAAVTVTYFHFMNIKDPNWPPPRWFDFGVEEPEPIVETRAVLVNRGGEREILPPEPQDGIRRMIEGVEARDMRVFVKLLPARGTAQNNWVNDGGVPMPSGAIISQPADWRQFITVLEKFRVIEPVRERRPVKFLPEFRRDGNEPNVEAILGRLGL